MHKFQRRVPSHWWSCPEGGSVFLVGQAVDALFKLHVLDWNEVVLGMSLYPHLAHMKQSIVPQLTGSVGCYVHFFPAYPGMHQV